MPPAIALCVVKRQAVDMPGYCIVYATDSSILVLPGNFLLLISKPRLVVNLPPHSKYIRRL